MVLAFCTHAMASSAESAKGSKCVRLTSADYRKELTNRITTLTWGDVCSSEGDLDIGDIAVQCGDVAGELDRGGRCWCLGSSCAQEEQHSADAQCGSRLLHRRT